ncbi:MAG: hypothetical protein V2I67_14925 [Thermoanaerobaculales bacterium]|jgi:hypothetical protein|nr:hypothetical protein [Thermoanaerobaculales bacterium]
MGRLTRTVVVIAILLSCLTLIGCSGNVGVGLSVGVPVGNHGYVSVGSHGWL